LKATAPTDFTADFRRDPDGLNLLGRRSIARRSTEVDRWPHF
jgi:hypothetical protein